MVRVRLAPGRKPFIDSRVKGGGGHAGGIGESPNVSDCEGVVKARLAAGRKPLIEQSEVGGGGGGGPAGGIGESNVSDCVRV